MELILVWKGKGGAIIIKIGIVPRKLKPDERQLGNYGGLKFRFSTSRASCRL